MQNLRSGPYDRILSPDEVVVLSGIATAGDFDHNGVLDVLDIDALSAIVRSGQYAAEYDINSDGSISDEDRRVWVEERKHTYFGDANLDGKFDTSDLVYVFIRGNYERQLIDEASWQDGDWNGDGVVNSGDLIAAFAGGGYEAGPRPSANVVPEPSSIMVAAVGLLACMSLCRRSARRCRQ